MKSSAVVLLCLSTLCPVLGQEASSLRVTNHENQHRELGFLDDICTNAIQGIAGTAGFLNCTCSASFIPPSGSAYCATAEEFCPITDFLCGTPSLSFGLDAAALLQLSLPISVELCYEDASVLGIPIDFVPLCFAFGRNILDLIRGAAGLTADSAIPGTCETTYGGDVCNSCTPCLDAAGEIGTTFDCSNINEYLVSTVCSAVGLDHA